MTLAFGIAELFLVILFVLTIAHLLTLKMCSNVLDHRTAPLFIGGWTLIGLLVTAPVFGHLLPEALPVLSLKPWLFALIAIKAAVVRPGSHPHRLARQLERRLPDPEMVSRSHHA